MFFKASILSYIFLIMVFTFSVWIVMFRVLGWGCCLGFGCSFSTCSTAFTSSSRVTLFGLWAAGL